MGLIITIGGSPGSGKSVIGKMLAQHLKIPYFGMGEIRRQYGLERGISVADANRLAELDPMVDHAIDEFMQTLPAKHDSLIADGRTAFHFLPKSVKIYLITDYKTAAKRIMTLKRASEQWQSIEEGMAALQHREEADNARYKRYYNIDPADLSQYDLVLDTSKSTPEETLKKVLEFLEKTLSAKDNVQ